MERLETGTIGVNCENSSVASGSSKLGCAVQSVASEEQAAGWIGAVVVRVGSGKAEVMEGREGSSISIHAEDNTVARGAAVVCCAIQNTSREKNRRVRTSTTYVQAARGSIETE